MARPRLIDQFTNIENKYIRYRLRHPLRVKTVFKNWYERNREANIERVLDWQNRNYARVLLGRKHRFAAQSVEQHIAHVCRARMHSAVNGSGSKKSSKSTVLLGCSWQLFRGHIESLFKPGMTWDNHGEVWELDHIRPISTFDLAQPEQQREAFNYMNVQPLFVVEHRKKHSERNRGVTIN